MNFEIYKKKKTKRNEKIILNNWDQLVYLKNITFKQNNNSDKAKEHLKLILKI